VQKLTGVINWICPYLGITNVQLQPLLELLEGDTDLTAPRQLTKEAKKAIEAIEFALANKFVWRISPDMELQVYIIVSVMPYAILAQWNDQ
ncbi:POK18 protein, partial [Smithornis capensis]|nr:POK18 protein [Smithornis capensis]